MRTIIAGSRNIGDYNILLEAITESGFNITAVISGTARGVDRLGERYAEENNIILEKYPAEWNNLGKRAGYVRNIKMAENADALIALWDGYSKGTGHMIDIANNHNLKIYIKISY